MSCRVRNTYDIYIYTVCVCIYIYIVYMYVYVCIYKYIYIHTSLLPFEVSAKSSWWEAKRQLNVSAKHWMAAKPNTEILLILDCNSFLRCLYLPVSSASGYTPFQFGQLIRRTGEWRQLNFSSWRGAAQSCLPCLKVRSYGTLLLRYLLIRF